MGGDFAPHAILEGVVQALPELLVHPGELILLGDEELIRPILSKRKYQGLKHALEHSSTSPFRIRLIHTPQSIDVEDSIRAIRKKPNATINVGCQLAAQSYHQAKAPHPRVSDALDSKPSVTTPAAFISAGHSGAVLTSALVQMGRLSHVERPAIAVKLPTLSQDGCVLLDAGANVDCRPEHLRDFAIMGAIYAHVERKSKTLPRVGLLSNGEEETKGNELTRTSFEMIKNLPIFQPGPTAVGEFIGHVEGKEIFRGRADVVVTDGFVGNVVLKSLEGLGSAVVTILKKEAKMNPLTSLGFLLSAGVFARFKRKLDYAEYGAAPLLGVAGYAFICHGRSNPKAIKNALLRAKTAVNSQSIERLESALLNTARIKNGGLA
jgi:glycerol-3-phosphate acyltransferase PlsX